MTPDSWMLLVLAALTGAAAAFSSGGVFVLLLAAATCAALHRGMAGSKDRNFLIGLFLLGFSARVFFSLGLDLGSWMAEGSPPGKRGPIAQWNLGIVDKTRDYLRMGDSDYYSQRGYCLAQYVQGVREPVVLQRIQEYGDHAYVPLIGWFYYLFGYSPISVKWLNGWIGALHILAIFFLARSCFQATIARWAGIGVAFFPTLILWSSTNLKEPLIFLLTALLLLCFRAVQVERRPARKALRAVLSLAVFALLCKMGRQESFMILAACLILAGVAEWLVRKKWTAILLLGVLALVPLRPWAKLDEALGKMVYRHMAYNYGLGMTYRYLPGQYYYAPGALEWGSSKDIGAGAVIRQIPKALLQYLLEPFPSRAGDRLTVLLLPQMVLWYFLLPFALAGMATALRWNFWNSAFFAAPLLIWILTGALSNGNIGTLVRLRDMVTPMVLIFAAAGLWVFARGREGLG